MAITKFIPEIWSAALLTKLRDGLVYGQPGIINRNYEGNIARAGDTVHITSVADPDVRTYTKYTDITYDQLTDSELVLTVDQSKYFAFMVDDIDRRQALPGFVAEATTGAGYNLSANADAYLATLMAAGVSASAPDNQIGAITVAKVTPEGAYDLLVEFRTLLTRSNTPVNGRWAVVPPEFYAVLLRDERFIRADASGTTAGLRNGYVGRAAGFDILEANTVPESTGVYTVLAGHGIATTYAEQIVDVEALRLQNIFGDGVRGLHLFGAKVMRPANLASALVTIA